MARRRQEMVASCRTASLADGDRIFLLARINADFNHFDGMPASAARRASAHQMADIDASLRKIILPLQNGDADAALLAGDDYSEIAVSPASRRPIAASPMA